ncbi:MAG: thiamine diphosphokinase [Anaerolineae bacterium]|jgi:thiamine pyrophosphokinase|nr:thiamine diphosphokinase [Anaerolineae bacterium]
MDALIFANGEALDGPAVRQSFESLEDALIIAADGGALNAAYFGYTPAVVLGDLDSLQPADAERLEHGGTTILRYSAEKDETDLELALMYAAKQGVKRIVVVGGVGGRLDQTFANVYLLALSDLIERDVVLVAGNQTVRLLRPGRHMIHGAAGDTLSLIPLGGPALGVSTTGLQYPLHSEPLRFGQARGISNVLTSANAQIHFSTGLLLMIHTIGRA